MVGRHSRILRMSGLGLGICILFSVPGFSTAQRPSRDVRELLRSSPKILAAFQKVVEQAGRSTVRVVCDGKEVALGTIVDADGMIVTKASELEGKISCRLKDGRDFPARIIGVHDRYDLAMLKIDARGLATAAWRESTTAEPGAWLASPGLGDVPVAIGVVSVATRKSSPRDFPPSLPPANSGYLGINLDNGDGGAKITEVVSGSAAEKAGLKVHDVLFSLNGKTVVDGTNFRTTLQRFKPGQVVTLGVRRGQEQLEVKATLDKRPANRLGPDMQNVTGKELSVRRSGFPVILQHDTVLKPADCGGPLVDLDGKVVGVNIARAGRIESYAVPSEVVRGLLGDLKSGKLAPKKVEASPPTSADKTKVADKPAQPATNPDKTSASKSGPP